MRQQPNTLFHFHEIFLCNFFSCIRLTGFMEDWPPKRIASTRNIVETWYREQKKKRQRQSGKKKIETRKID